MVQNLLAYWKDVPTEAVYAEVHRHCVRAEQVNHFFVDVTEVGVGSEALIDISDLLATIW